MKLYSSCNHILLIEFENWSFGQKVSRSKMTYVFDLLANLPDLPILPLVKLFLLLVLH